MKTVKFVQGNDMTMYIKMYPSPENNRWLAVVCIVNERLNLGGGYTSLECKMVQKYAI